MQLDPTVWGLSFGEGDTVSLLDMTVRSARRFFTHAASLSRAPKAATRLPGYVETGALWPRIWPLDTSPTAPLPATATDAQLDLLGLLGLEERWRRVAASRVAAAAQLGEVANPGDADPLPLNTPPAWLALQPPPPRPSRAQRRALIHGPPPLPDPRRAFSTVWRPLLDPTITPSFVITAWRVLHGQIGCNAFLTHVRHRHSPFDAASSLCSSPVCTASHSVETISHAFFSCPEVQPVISWLFDLWALLHPPSASTPSLSILLSDDHSGWPTCPSDDPPLLRLWHFLRITTIGAIWRVRCARDESLHRGSFARRVAILVVDTVISAIQRDWIRTQEDVRTLDDGHFCHDWWRGFDVSIPLDRFVKLWASPPALCRVVTHPPAQIGGQPSYSLDLHISRTAPLPLPP